MSAKEIHDCKLGGTLNDFSPYIDITVQDQILIDFLVKLKDRYKRLNYIMKTTGEISIEILNKITKRINSVVIMKRGKPTYFISEKLFNLHFNSSLIEKNSYEYGGHSFKIAEYKNIKAYSRLVCRGIIGRRIPSADILADIDLGYMLSPEFK